MGKATAPKVLGRRRRQRRVRRKVVGTEARPRLCVFRSNKHIYAQVIDDARGVTLVAASSAEKDFPQAEDDNKVTSATKVGQLVAERSKAAGIEQVVFDRNGYRYASGRVRALAEGARDGGLQF